MSDPLVAFVEKQEWLAPVQEAGEHLVKSAYEAAGEQGAAIKNALHGVWLGHPLHSAVTDVPVGSWTAACVLDAMEAAGHDEYAAGADAAIAVGLVGAVGSAVSGLTDWSETHGKPQRVGAMHGLLNTAAALLYGTSYVLRKTGRRSLARGLSFTGYGIVLASAYLGGALAYNQRVGVNHAPDLEEELSGDFEPICQENDLPEGELKKFELKGTPIVLAKQDGRISGLAETCSHAGGPLSEGKLEGDSVVCPWHGSRFCLRDGKVLRGPATTPQPALEVVVRDGQVMARPQKQDV